jgi:predicted TIM-barrel fold metal-dependent hydrolase
MIKIFDSTTHPTLTGKWNNIKKKTLDASFEYLDSQMKRNGVFRACAMGLDRFEEYNHEKFIKICKKYKNLVPIAGVNPHNKDISNEVKKIQKLGYKGVKIHPRYSDIQLDKKKFNNFLRELENTGMVLMLCTYEHAQIGNHQKDKIINIIYDTFQNIHNLKTILVHGGSIDILNYSEFVRNNKNNFLLDMSMTMQKYKGSSVEKDIFYLFNNFDERICIGSDHPEYTLKQLRQDFNYYSSKLRQNKRKNIAYKNLNKFFGYHEKD